MAKRRSKKGVMEWVTETNIQTTAATNLLTVIDFDLNPDEVAEIRKVRMGIRLLQEDFGDADDLGLGAIVLSTDPSTDINPLGVTAATFDDLEDEEVFLFHRTMIRATLQGTVASMLLWNEQQEWEHDFPSDLPLMVGRNVGMTIRYDETASILSGIEGYTTIFFKRRKGTPEEILNLIKH